MKKQILMVAAVALALGGCSKTETTEVAQGRAIGFDAFVGKSTKAVTEVTNTNLKKFYVFGSYGSTGNWTPVFTNVEVSGGTVAETEGTAWTPAQTAYWQPSTTYHFGAYSDGNNSSTTASFGAEEQKLTFTNYTVGENDLIVAISDKKTTTEDVSAVDPVSLSFQHMLSQVKFTFKNEDSYDYTMKISDIKIGSAVKTATGTFTKENSVIAWNGTAEATYDFGDLEDIAEAEGEGTHEVVLFVIPQSNETLKVTFTATFTDDSDSETPIAKGDFEASLAYAGDAEGTEANEWTPGFKYNYTATVNGSTINENLDKQVIKFTVTAVKGWKDATEQNPTLDKQEGQQVP